jgi:uncharacterized protein YecE (DUF72 family)
VERTPADFAFNLKAFRLFTGHQTPAKALPRDVQAALAGHFATKKNLYYRDTPAEIRDLLWHRFESAVRPLREAGKLRALHFQFAPWVHRSARAMDHILECAQRLDGYHLAVEFRHRSWFEGDAAADTLAFERAHDLTHVVVDEPQGFENSIPTVWAVTSDKLALLRLHGRNHATWNIGGEAASDRFNYDYSDTELAALAIPLKRMARELGGETHAIFNNNYGDQGQRNAASLQALLADQASA